MQKICLAVLSLAAFLAFGARVDVPAAHFTGGWKLDAQFMDIMGSPYLLAHGAGVRVADAVAHVRVPRAGAWRVWVRTRTWVDAKGADPAPSDFRVMVGGHTLAKVFGREGAAWHWEDGGVQELPAGVAAVALRDLSGFDARCAGVVLADAGDPAPQGALAGLDRPAAETVAADLVVVGGGIPGTCAAVAAARRGLRVALVQDRPVLGGNASEEIRVWCAGEIGNDVVEAVRGRYMNMEQQAAIVDRERLRLIDENPLIDCRLSHRAFGVEMKDGRIAAVKALDLANDRVVRFCAPLAVDATGDGWVGFWAGADWRMGREGTSEYGETMAPEAADGDTLGASLMWTTRRASVDSPFSAPWAEPWAQGISAIHGEWNWEYGIHRNVIRDGEGVRDRLLLAIYGAFSNAKREAVNNRMVFDFLPFLLGKRESRRLLGDWVLSEKDVTEKRAFPDAVSRGSWSVDLHYDTYKPGVDYLTVCKQPHFGRYYIPFRATYSRNVPNLMMAGRCFSCTHVGLGGPRVINTLAMLGVSCGYAAAICKEQGILPREVHARGLVRRVQRELGGDWPGNPDPAKAAWGIVDDEDAAVKLTSGWSHSFCANGNTVKDQYAHARAGAKGGGPLVYPLPVAAAGRYRLMRNLPFLPWNPVPGVSVAELASGGRTTRLEMPALEHVGGWAYLGTYELAPGATLTLLPQASAGKEVIADGFAVVPESAPIVDTLSNLPRYAALHPALPQILAFLRRPDLRELPDGRYPVGGVTVFLGANLPSVDSKEPELCVPLKDALSPLVPEGSFLIQSMPPPFSVRMVRVALN